MKRLFLILSAVLLIFFVTFIYNQRPQKTYKETVLEIKDASLYLEIADTPEQRERGLSGRDKLRDDHGMLFIFEYPLIPGFWMKDMRFPLDMAWIDKDYSVVGIAKDIPPESYPKTFQPPSPVKYVLEVNAGWADKNNIRVGDTIQLHIAQD